jgi:DNA-binding CsgD family transcriptional regulator
MKTLVELGLQVNRSNTEDEFRETLEEVIGFMQGTTYSAFTHQSQRTSTPRAIDEPQGIHNLPSGYLKVFDSPAIGRADPVMQHCRFSSTPIYWNRITYAEPGLTPQWEQMEAHGLRQGIGTALHPEPHRHFALGVEWDRGHPFTLEEQKDLSLALQTLSTFAEPAAFRIWQAELPLMVDDEQRPLSDRERECMHWASRGMTDELIARIMEISARTVRKHIESCIVKLSAANRTEAAVIATKLGLLRRLNRS